MEYVVFALLQVLSSPESGVEMNQFTTGSGRKVNSISPEDYDLCLKTMEQELGLRRRTTAEIAGTHIAYAFLSSPRTHLNPERDNSELRVLGIVEDSFAGLATIAALHKLDSCGLETKIATVSSHSGEFRKALHTYKIKGGTVVHHASISEVAPKEHGNPNFIFLGTKQLHSEQPERNCSAYGKLRKTLAQYPAALHAVLAEPRFEGTTPDSTLTLATLYSVGLPLGTAEVLTTSCEHHLVVDAGFLPGWPHTLKAAIAHVGEESGKNTAPLFTHTPFTSLTKLDGDAAEDHSKVNGGLTGKITGPVH